MQRHYGNMLNEFTIPSKSKLLVFTANGVLTNSHKLVMGAGIAKTIKEQYPDIDSWFGNALLGNPRLLTPAVTKHNEDVYVYKYGVLRGVYKGQAIAALQTKLHFSTPSPLELVKQSLLILEQVAKGNYEEVHLTMPGVGYGKLPLREVLPLVEHLPDNFHVWSKRDMF